MDLQPLVVQKYPKALPVLQNCVIARTRHSSFRNIVSIRAWSLPSRETDQPAVRNARALFTSDADRTAKAALSTARGRTAYAEQTFDLQGFLPTLRPTVGQPKRTKEDKLTTKNGDTEILRVRIGAAPICRKLAQLTGVSSDVRRVLRSTDASRTKAFRSAREQALF